MDIMLLFQFIYLFIMSHTLLASHSGIEVFQLEDGTFDVTDCFERE